MTPVAQSRWRGAAPSVTENTLQLFLDWRDRVCLVEEVVEVRKKPGSHPPSVARTLGLSLMQCFPNLGHFLRQPFFIRQREFVFAGEHFVSEISQCVVCDSFILFGA